MTKTGVLDDNTFDSSVTDRITADPDNMGYNIYNEVTGGIDTILTDETTRLNDKETKINKLYETHKRNKHFKNSAAKRNNAYWRMFMVLLLLAIIVVLLYMFRTNFPFVPSWAMDLVLIAVVAGGFIYMFTMYENIMKRDLTDFDKLDPYSPVMLRDKQIKKAEDLLDKGKISASIVAKAKPEDCQGEDCCMTGTYFDTNTKICTESFTNWSTSLGYSSI